MTTPTELVMLAIVSALTDAANGTGAVLPLPTRNEDLPSRLTDVGLNLRAHLNVLDGTRAEGDEMLGADLLQVESYDLRQLVEIEWVVAGGESVDRERHFDLGRKAIWDALKPVVSVGIPTYLAGNADGIRLVDIVQHQNTNVAGVPNVKACVFVFEVTYTSTDPF